MMRKLVGSISIVVGLMVATIGSAEEAGTASLTVDGTEYQFKLNAMQSDWSGSESYASLNIWLSGADDDTRKTFPGMTLGFEYVGGQPNAVEMRLMKYEGGKTQRLYGNPDTSALVLDQASVVIDGNEISLSGTFSSSFGTSGDFGRTIDYSSGISAEGSFSVTLGPV
ncbi:hypothetical protein ALP8811_02151 [Aliiroseovarius pelagivivens]|uniref:Lipid/polyisoprenoid-binding YceI-like domain-containing protein n=1 Tax=Aliiroseovarius pelagivivens TaxID=1639690 RepID=A0A2R8AM72_9RHOB|nr:hypothetical protein [Aliiroseovarius pelagivivens]SPF77128.1 hypothetical protein ALP8811_02151 [Aliiroseovarius pelagivivens]